ncbi:MAG: hypothetical protein II998_09775 [Clostridia bacterium]|nr:hypothetical protein [Clostridia bacterium]
MDKYKMDSFTEYMIKQKWKKGTILKCLLIVAAAFFVSMFILLVCMFLPFAMPQNPITQVFINIGLLLIVGIFYGAYRMIARFDVEFEYALTNSELDVDKIIRRKRRTNVVSIDVKAFIRFGKKSEENKELEAQEEYSRVIDATANSKTHEDYYAVFFKNGQKIKLYFNPTQKMIEVFKIYAPRVVK